jgi:glycosyltransferase involved in cell wall biosynthesis
VSDRSAAITPDVSVVMPVYNGARHVESAVASILGQTFADFELIVVDDGSTDATLEMLGRIADPRLTVIHAAHAGNIAARTTGVHAARGRRIAWMDSDDLCHPERLEREVRLLDAHPECLFVVSTFSIVTPYGKYLTRTETFDWRYLEPADLTFATLPLADPTGMFDRAAGLDVGLFDPDLTDEKPLWYKLLDRGRGAVLGEPLYWYRWTMGSLSRDDSRSQAAADTSLAVRRRYDPARADDPRVAASSDPARFRTRYAAKAVDYYLLAGDYRAAREVAVSAWRRWPASRRAAKLVLMSLLRRRSLRRPWGNPPHPLFTPAPPPWVAGNATSADAAHASAYVRPQAAR